MDLRLVGIDHKKRNLMKIQGSPIELSDTRCIVARRGMSVYGKNETLTVPLVLPRYISSVHFRTIDRHVSREFFSWLDP